jgi:hypothetical protein
MAETEKKKYIAVKSFFSGNMLKPFISAIDTTGAPDWVKLMCINFQSVRKNNYNQIYGKNFILNGTKKLVFEVGSFACSIEIMSLGGLKRRALVYERLHSIKSCHMLYPSEIYIMKAGVLGGEIYHFYFQKMNYCVEGDIMRYIESRPKNKLSTSEFLNIGSVLSKLHSVNVYPMDIKIENTLVCICGEKKVFALADLDDSVLGDNIIRSEMVGTRGYSGALLLNDAFPGGLNTDSLEYTDWHAFSQTVLEYYTDLDYNAQEYRDNEKKIISNGLEFFKKGNDRQSKMMYYCCVLLHNRDDSMDGWLTSSQMASNLVPPDVKTLKEMNQMMRELFNEDVEMLKLSEDVDMLKLKF